jgi:hypothetical protein
VVAGLGRCRHPELDAGALAWGAVQPGASARLAHPGLDGLGDAQAGGGHGRVEAAAAVGDGDQYPGVGWPDRHHGTVGVRVLADVGQGLTGSGGHGVDGVDRQGQVGLVSLQVSAQAPRRLGVAHRGQGHGQAVRLAGELAGDQLPQPLIALAPVGTRVALTVQRLEDGEVSPYLTDELRPGDKIELRGPIGGYFVWEPSEGGPLMLVAGGSGIVPLMAMIRDAGRARAIGMSCG